MPCKHCSKDITGNFIVFNPCAWLQDHTKSSISPPNNTAVKLSLDISSHSNRNNAYTSVDLCDHLTDVSNFSNTIVQNEEAFCSKECLLEWFKNVINVLMNP